MGFSYEHAHCQNIIREERQEFARLREKLPVIYKNLEYSYGLDADFDPEMCKRIRKEGNLGRNKRHQKEESGN